MTDAVDGIVYNAAVGEFEQTPIQEATSETNTTSELEQCYIKIAQLESEIFELKLADNVKKLLISIRSIDSEIDSNFVVNLNFEQLTALNASLTRVAYK